AAVATVLAYRDMTLADRERQEMTQFDAGCIETHRVSISQVNAFLAQETPLDTHLQRMESYLPVAEGITTSADALQECLAQHPVDKLVTEECTPLLESLTPLADRFHTQCE
ncbi:hypothetical protein KIPB_012370, partial [Kipferlia bialata]